MKNCGLLVNETSFEVVRYKHQATSFLYMDVQLGKVI